MYNHIKQIPHINIDDPMQLQKFAYANMLFFDVDDTLTWHGLLPVETLDAIYRAHHAGFRLVAVTGRSCAWAEMMLRIFPLDAAIAETGAACYLKEYDAADQHGHKHMRIRLVHSEMDPAKRADHDKRRHEAAQAVLEKYPHARLALDNSGRLYDTAFDLREDGPLIDESTALGIRTLLQERGLTVAQSSVHINAWFGAFNKATMVEQLLSWWGISWDDAKARLVYVGDSGNDGPLFARVPLSVGVRNVEPHLAKLAERGELPAFIVDGDGGYGFAQLVNALLAARQMALTSDPSLRS